MLSYFTNKKKKKNVKYGASSCTFRVYLRSDHVHAVTEEFLNINNILYLLWVFPFYNNVFLSGLAGRGKNKVKSETNLIPPHRMAI